MHERIKELYTQASKDLDITQDILQKFAELIVKETMQVVANQLPGNQYLDVAHAVIEHFGDEEHHAD